jgi:hypothetical protein
MRASHDRNENDPAWVAVLCRMYSSALRLYPRGHRRRWGAQMQQAFRDRCREAVRSGHGPMRVLFADLLPDLAASAGRERIESVKELPPMKRYLLVVLFFAAMGSLLFHAQLSSAAAHARQMWNQRQEIAALRAQDGHLLALAAAVERDRRGPSEDVTAALLYWWGADGRDLHHLSSAWPQRTAAESAMRNAQLDHADAAFARALRSDDHWALWLAVMDCPARSTVCARDASLARLREIDAGNGATWLAELQAALDVHDATRERNALARFAQATHYDTHYGDLARALFAAFDKLPLPTGLETVVADPAATTQELADAQRIAWAQNLFGADALPAYKPLLDYCRTRNPQTDAERAADCAAVGKLMTQSNASMELEVMIGLRAWLRAAPSAVVPALQQRIRDERWTLQALQQLSPRENSASSFLEWKAAWMAGGGEREVAQRLMRQHGIPLQAPPEFQMEPRYLDPAY